jgi:hypothetical protein
VDAGNSGTPALRIRAPSELKASRIRAVSEPYPSRKRALSEPEASQIPESEGVGRRAAAIGSNCTRALSIRMSHGHQGSGLVLGQARRTYGSQASGSFVAGAAPAKWGANCTARQVVRDRLPGLARLATVRYRSCRNAIRRSARRVPSPLIRALSARRTERYFEWPPRVPGSLMRTALDPAALLAASATVTGARLCFYA